MNNNKTSKIRLLRAFESKARWTVIILYCMLFIFSLLESIVLDNNFMLEFLFFIYIAIGVFFSEIRYGQIYLAGLSLFFISLGSIWFLSPSLNLVPLYNNLGLIGFYFLISLVIAMLVHLIRKDIEDGTIRIWHLKEPLIRSTSKRTAINLALIFIGLVIIFGPFWPIIRVHSGYMYINSTVGVENTSRAINSFNFTASIAPRPFYLIEPECVDGWDANVLVNFSSRNYTDMFVMTGNDTGTIYNSTGNFQFYQNLIQNLSAYYTISSKSGTFGGPINGNCFKIIILTSTLNNMKIRINESYTVLKTVYTNKVSKRPFVNISNLTYGSAIQSLGYVIYVLNAETYDT